MTSITIDIIQTTCILMTKTRRSYFIEVKSLWTLSQITPSFTKEIGISEHNQGSIEIFHVIYEITSISGFHGVPPFENNISPAWCREIRTLTRKLTTGFVMKTQSFLPTKLVTNPLWPVVRFHGFHEWICWWCWFGNCNISVNSLIPLSLLTKGAQTITKIIQMIKNSIYTLTSFSNFMNDQRYFWLRWRWFIFSLIVTLQYLIWISGQISDWQNFTRWTDLIPD